LGIEPTTTGRKLILQNDVLLCFTVTQSSGQHSELTALLFYFKVIPANDDIAT